MARKSEPAEDDGEPGASAEPEGEAAPASPTGAAASPAPSSGGKRRADAQREPWRSYKELVAGLAGRVVEAQRPIRVLQAVRWDPSVEEAFRKSRYRELPKVGVAEYQAMDLGFDPRTKADEFADIERDIERDIGDRDDIGRILRDTAEQYRQLCYLLAARGTKEFHTYSAKLYGSPKDRFPDGKTTLRDSGRILYETLTTMSGQLLGVPQPRDVTAEQAAEMLNERFQSYFHPSPIPVQVDDGILADAAAGSDYVKIRSGATFSSRDIDILEVHEGWVHVGTSLNGQAQPVARWLAKGPPRTTTVQEGLAALVEILTLRTYPRRARRLNDRVLAVDKAEDGASFLDVFEWFRTEGYEEDECFHNAHRIFRGGVVEGGAPFTKDACYAKGIILNYSFIRAAFQQGKAHLIPFLFVGKVAHEDVPVLWARTADGVVKPPVHVPPLFRDLNGLAIWMAYSGFLSRLGTDAVTEYYAKMFSRAEGLARCLRRIWQDFAGARRPQMAEKFATFEEFWPYYVKEHAQKSTRTTHAMGTTLALSAVVAALLSRRGKYLALAPLAGYGFAWASHFFIEKNRPATFTYPRWSLLGDFVMLKKIFEGSMDEEVERVLKMYAEKEAAAAEASRRDEQAPVQASSLNLVLGGLPLCLRVAVPSGIRGACAAAIRPFGGPGSRLTCRGAQTPPPAPQAFSAGRGARVGGDSSLRGSRLLVDVQGSSNAAPCTPGLFFTAIRSDGPAPPGFDFAWGRSRESGRRSVRRGVLEG